MDSVLPADGWRPARSGEHNFVCDEGQDIGASVVGACYTEGVGKLQPRVRVTPWVNNLSRNYSIANVVKEIKRTSSRSVKESHHDRLSSIGKMGTGHSPSVSQSNLDQVIRYIETQDEHHQRVTFQDEYRAFLKAYGIESTNGTCGTEPAARTLSGYTQFENVFFLPGCYPGL
ncbi:MAG: transposase [Acidobacteriota bacterium]|nr:transposase [Acidobacteriota bacterium]